MVLNNQNTPTERKQFLERNITQECDISLDPEINLGCCEFFKELFNGNLRVEIPCDRFYRCDQNNFHCVLDIMGIIAICIGILLALFLIFIACYLTNDWIRRKVDNLISNLPWNSGRTEANSIEMKE